MGTKVFKITKFKSRNWIFYNAFDSEPEGLGESLVDNIPMNTEDYHGEYLMVDDTIEVETQGSEDNSIVRICEIRSLEDGHYLLLVSWYCSRKEMYQSKCKNKKSWPQGHSHMESNHMQIIMWDTTNRKVSTEESSRFSPGRIFDWYHTPTRIQVGGSKVDDRSSRMTHSQ